MLARDCRKTASVRPSFESASSLLGTTHLKNQRIKLTCMASDITIVALLQVHARTLGASR